MFCTKHVKMAPRWILSEKKQLKDPKNILGHINIKRGNERNMNVRSLDQIYLNAINKGIVDHIMASLIYMDKIYYNR